MKQIRVEDAVGTILSQVSLKEEPLKRAML